MKKHFWYAMLLKIFISHIDLNSKLKKQNFFNCKFLSKYAKNYHFLTEGRNRGQLDFFKKILNHLILAC